MAFKVFSLMVVFVAGELHHPSFGQDSLPYDVPEGDHQLQNSYVDGGLNGFNAIIQRQYFPVTYSSQSIFEGGGSAWNYAIPVSNTHSLISTTNYPAIGQVLPLAASWTHDHVPLAYSSSSHLDSASDLVQVKGEATPTTGSSRPEDVPFGYVPSVAKINVPPGYKIH